MPASPAVMSRKIYSQTAIPTFVTPGLAAAVTDAFSLAYNAPTAGDCTMAAHPTNRATDSRTTAKHVSFLLYVTPPLAPFDR